ncbi:unnamed protein product, partial [Polarella glacialis]
AEPAPVWSRRTDSSVVMTEAGFAPREPTPERRTTPGQVVRGGYRPKDNLSFGCLAADNFADHPLNLPRKAGSGASGVGSGGAVHLVAGPMGFMPAGPGYDAGYEAAPPLRVAPTSFKPLWGNN